MRRLLLRCLGRCRGRGPHGGERGIGPPPRAALVVTAIVAAAAAGGCSSRGHEITISTRPPDAELHIDGRLVGRGPVTETFKFDEDQPTHTITASRFGYKEQTFTLTEAYADKEVVLTLPPRSRRVTISVQPVPAIVGVDGKALSPEPVSQIAQDLVFHLDPQDQWIPHTASAERPGFRKTDIPIRWTDQDNRYTITLEPLKKDVSIVTRPPGAEIYLNDEPRGRSPLTIQGLVVPFDAKTQRWEAMPLRAEKPGYEPATAVLSWESGRTEYVLDLGVKTKPVRVFTDPPDAQVRLDGPPGVQLRRDASGAWAGTLAFPPTDDKGSLKVYTGMVSKQMADAAWQPAPLRIGWDDGRQEYHASLAEWSRQVPLLRPAWVRDSRGGWQVRPERVMTTSRVSVAEPDGRRPTRITSVLPKGTTIDSLDLSPDGQQLVFSALKEENGRLLSQLCTVNADGTGGLHAVTDGKNLDLMPSYSPDGRRILFSSDRPPPATGGADGANGTAAASEDRRMRVWWIAADGDGPPTPLTPAGTTALWPSLDSLPRPRLFYEARADARADARICVLPLAGDGAADGPVNGSGNSNSGNSNAAAAQPTDLAAGRHPRINARADRVLVALGNEKTGRRDIGVVPDGGEREGKAVRLTNTPELDEFDAVWSHDGRRVAFAADRPAAAAAKAGDLNIWVMDPDRPESAAPITANESWDDCPAWEPIGRAVYFRSNRGGEWAIWRIELK